MQAATSTSRILTTTASRCFGPVPPTPAEQLASLERLISGADNGVAPGCVPSLLAKIPLR